MLNHKTIKTILTITAVCLISLARAEEKEGSKIELIPVYEKTFDDTIVNVIFDTATVSIEEAKKIGWKEEAFTILQKEKNGKVAVLYPKIVFIGNGSKISWDPHENARQIREIRFYASDGKLLKRINTKPRKEKIICSNNGRYILRARVPDEYDIGNQGGILYNDNGAIIWEKNDLHLIDVSNDGYVVAKHPTYEAEPTQGHILYDSFGREITTISNPLKDKSIGYDAAKFSPQGNYIVIGYSNMWDRSIIILATKEGKILWQRELPYSTWTPNEAVVAEGFGIFGIADELGIDNNQETLKNVYIYYVDWKGILQWVVPLNTRTNMVLKMSGDSKKIYVMSGTGFLYCVKIEDGSILWEHREPWSPIGIPVKAKLLADMPLFDEMQINEGIIIARGINKNRNLSILHIFNEDSGKEIGIMNFKQSKLKLLTTFSNLLGILDIGKKKILYMKEVQK